MKIQCLLFCIMIFNIAGTVLAEAPTKVYPNPRFQPKTISDVSIDPPASLYHSEEGVVIDHKDITLIGEDGCSQINIGSAVNNTQGTNFNLEQFNSNVTLINSDITVFCGL